MAISLAIHPTFRIMGLGRTVTLPALTPLYAGVILMFDCPAPLVNVMWKLSDSIRKVDAVLFTYPPYVTLF